MKKLILLFVILLLGTFIYISVQVRGDENSEFNKTTRYELGKKSWARTLFGLHKDGDARGNYLVGTTPIVIELVEPRDNMVSQEGIQNFIKRVEEYTGRRVEYISVDTIQYGTISANEIQQIVNTKRRHVKPGQPNLFIIYAEDFIRDEKEVGSTYKEFGIIVSHNKLKSLTERYFDAMADYTTSTLLHEFGHQIGMEHVEKAGCVMDTEVENPTSAFAFSGSLSQTEFCNLELEQLSNIKKLLQ
jgi:hypothetical protein